MARSSSLRSKISLSALRSKSSSRDDKADDGIGGSETVQVQDTDFELVRPSASRPRASEDISMNGKALSGGTDGRPSLLRVDSPAASMMSGSASDLRSPVSPSAQGQALPPGAPSAGAVEAHRARELKWVAAMASTPPAQARKSKKVRRLLQEGVPASVRYQVWAHLSDSKAKRIEGLYAQLGERERVRVLGEIQRDAPHMRLRQPNGPLVSLLNAYLTMVPDIQYSKGLAFIAGQLLLQSPEEDAFWIFISLMDTHLRPYFSSNAIQLEVDATLFAKALEAADSTIAKRLFTGMSIPPIRLCRPWFTSLFVEALPTDYFQRVWDIFLSEGVVFLFRIGLALVACCRRALLDVNTEAEALNILLHPLPSLISSSPDTLIELANSVKLKDDDVRKQRVKMEAQVKRQAQNRLPNSARRSSNTTPASISLPRS
ncbi:rab-GTPase-TBC domain-containing protein [Gloeopeniophorella convolvens]|nr:rab-GTPase-TBC domain-containing protein [Gloeopeniophorella convolvens]